MTGLQGTTAVLDMAPSQTQVGPSSQMYQHAFFHTFLNDFSLKSPECSDDIRSFLNLKANPSLNYEVNLPKSCPLKPWQVAAIAVASVHVFAFVLNVAVGILYNFKLTDFLCDIRSDSSLPQAFDLWARLLCFCKY